MESLRIAYTGLAVSAALTALLSPDAQAALIASESFKANPVASPVAGEYTQGGIASGSNTAVIVGNTGFSAAKVWANNYSEFNVMASPSLTSSALPDTAQNGSLRVGRSNGLTRGPSRQLDATPQLSGSYYLSGLVSVDSATSMKNGDYMIMGFLGSAPGFNQASISTGFHLGVRKESDTIYLAAFAGNTVYNLAALPQYNAAFQIVLRLDVNAAGDETLTGWYAANGASELTLGLAATTIETWSGAGSLGYFAAQEVSASGAEQGVVYFDEMRFGTSLNEVTVKSLPAKIGLFFVG
jgi:hypothetical protein